MKKNDWLLIAALLLAGCVPPLFLLQGDGEKVYAEISIDGETKRTIPLTTDETFVVESPRGFNVVCVKDGAVTITDADCPDKICVKTAAAKNAGEAIACLPHGLLVELKSGR